MVCRQVNQIVRGEVKNPLYPALKIQLSNEVKRTEGRITAIGAFGGQQHGLRLKVGAMNRGSIHGRQIKSEGTGEL